MPITYTNLCRLGKKIQDDLDRGIGDVRRVVGLLEDAEQAFYSQIPRYRDELQTARQRVESFRGRLMQHVAHCTAGCARAQGGQTAFASENQPGVYSKAPSHAKPVLPPVAELAKRIRAGSTLDELGSEYERDAKTISQRLNQAGYSATTGLPQLRTSTFKTALHQLIDLVPEWTIDALCAQTDPEAFYPDKGGSTREAKAICASCPVQAECLDHALANGERYGIWGGVSERQRRRLIPTSPAAPVLDTQEETAS